jgi:hypothetical protein
MNTLKFKLRVTRTVNIIRYHNKISAPFISPDTFKRFSDLDLDAKFEHSAKNLKNATVIFCNSGDLNRFFETYGKVINAKILIFGNNDVDFNEFTYKIPKSVKKIYLQNSTLLNSLFRTIPIGIENMKYHTNGMPHLFAEKYTLVNKQKKLLVGPFGITHPERVEIQALKNNVFDLVDHLDSRLTPEQYAKQSSKYQYIACPRGNGLDTHRFWESLYRGSMPVVISSNWSNYFLQIGIPLLEIKDWSEIYFKIENLKNNNLKINPKKISALWDNYWLAQIRKDISG